MMKFLLRASFLFILTISINHKGIAKKDTTIIYCNADLEKVSEKKATHYAKISQAQDGRTVIQQYTTDGSPYIFGSYMDAEHQVKSGDFIYFNSNGIKSSAGQFERNQRTGIWQSFAENGTVIAHGKYENDERSGEWNYYFDDGKQKEISEFKSDKFHGLFIEWAENGTLITSGNYLNGEKNGEWDTWFNSGVKNYKGAYKNGERDGGWRFYHTNGAIASTEKYDAGELLDAEWLDEIGNIVPVPENLEVEPKFPGGNAAMTQFIMMELEYPEISRDQNEQGIVYIQFMVSVEGELSDFKIRRGVSDALDKEALRAAKKMPNWTPCMDHNRVLPVLFTLPIHFRLG